MLQDQNLLEDIARNDEETKVREAALGKITDGKIIIDIIRQSRDVNLRVSGFEKNNR